MGIILNKNHNQHRHQFIDNSHLSTDKAFETHRLGIRTLKLTLCIYLVTALFQFTIAMTSGSVALLADTLHNFADAFTSIPLWIAFNLARRGCTKRFNYGYGKVEDLSGILIVFVIFGSAVIAFHQAARELMYPEAMEHLGWVAVAAIIGYASNELVARLRINAGKKIGSAVLIADGYHARADAYTSLAVLIGVIGDACGYPILDPIVGIGITIAILFIVKETTVTVWLRLLDGIEPQIINDIARTSKEIDGVRGVHKIKARWIGHHIHTELTVCVSSKISMHAAQEIADNVDAALRKEVENIGSVTISLSCSC